MGGAPRAALGVVAASLALASAGVGAELPAKPNIVWILADDLGYGDLGSYGQELVGTPRLDALAAEGMRFTSFYSGSTVCAPARAVLMTGLHTGHGRIRGNARIPLAPQDTTVAEVLREAGYATGAFGKWGLGEPGSSGIPRGQGFDEWFGYLNQRHAHNYWPNHLWRNEERVSLPNWILPMGEGAGIGLRRVEYAPDRIVEEALEFLRSHRSRPFFLYFAPTLPHANNEAGWWGMEIPSSAPYSEQPWPRAQRNHAAMITLLDAHVGRILDALDELGLAQDTLVFFSSDNGPHAEGGADPEFFDSAGGLRGIKRDLYEGGIRVPMIVRWPGRVPAGVVSDVPWAMWDLLPTAAEVAGAEPPAGIDGISVVSLLLGGMREVPERVFYWEYHHGGPTKQAVRVGRWKAVRIRPGGSLELYDLELDPSESADVATRHDEVISRVESLLRSERTDLEPWSLPDR